METPTKIFLMIITFTLLLNCSSATVYKVGDSHGWTAKEDIYKEWIKDKEFHVGDSLTFEYNRYLNDDVTQFSGYLGHVFCDSSSPEAVYKTGHDVVTFKEPGFYFFITSNQTRCESGQRLDVVVYDTTSRLIPPPLPPPSNDNAGGFKTSKFPEEEDFPSESDYYEKIEEEKLWLRRQKHLRIKRELESLSRIKREFEAFI